MQHEIETLKTALQRATESVQALQSAMRRSPQIDSENIRAIAPLVEHSEILSAQICGLFTQMNQSHNP